MKNYRYLERRNMMIRRIGLWVGEVVAAILLAFLVIQFCFQTVTVHGDSMQPAYYDGDTVLVNKLDYRIGSPKRLDAVILELVERRFRFMTCASKLSCSYRVL